MADEKLVDVLVRTRNSEKYLKPCLEAINNEIPVGKIILVDNGSTDKTLEIASSYANVSVYVKPELNLGQMITFGVSQATTDWVAIIDSDLILRQGWWEDKKPYLEESDAIEGCEIGHINLEIPVDCTRLQYGRFGNTLLKRNYIQGINLDMNFGEDVAVWFNFKKRGLKWLKLGSLLADHYPKIEDLTHTRTGTKYISLFPIFIPKRIQIEHGHVARKYQSISYTEAIRTTLYTPLHDAYISFKKNFWFCLAYFRLIQETK
jgi:glycosyltransferase involved in cell wall biosynthesis